MSRRCYFLAIELGLDPGRLVAVLRVVPWLLAVEADGSAGGGIVRSETEKLEDGVLVGSSASALLTTVVPSVVPVIVLALGDECVEPLLLLGRH